MRLKVFLAHSGATFLIELPATSSVGRLKEKLALRVDIATHDQLTICEDGKNLSDSRPISLFCHTPSSSSVSSSPIPELPENKTASVHEAASLEGFDAVVFLFNKQFIRQSPPPSHANLLKFSIFVPEPTPRMQPVHPLLLESSSLMLRQLPEFENLFASHVNEAQQAMELCSLRVRECSAVLERVSGQRRASAAAVRNAARHYKNMSGNATLLEFHS